MKINGNVEFFGPSLSQQGQYTFYKGFKFKRSGKLEVVLLGEFILVKIWPEEETAAIAELQLCWYDRIQNGNFSSIKLYFLPEHTSEGRTLIHGQDEVISMSENVIIRIDDLISLVPETYQWQHGRIGTALEPGHIVNSENLGPIKDYNPPYSCKMNGVLCMKNIRKQKKLLGADCLTSQVIVVNYASYCRFRGALQRFKGNKSAFANAMVMALGGFAVPRENTRVLFCKDTFEYPELEGHELLCNYLAPKFPNKKPRKTPPKNEQIKIEVKPIPMKAIEAKVEELEEEIPRRQSLIKPCHRPLAVGSPAKPKVLPIIPDLPPRSLKLSAAALAEQTFLEKLYKFMKSRGTPIDRLPVIGTEKLNLYKFYTVVKKVGGYDAVGTKRLWRRLYLEMGGYCSNNAAATATRKQYERFLLPFERHMISQSLDAEKSNSTKSPSLQQPKPKQNGSLTSNGPQLSTRSTRNSSPYLGRKRRRKNKNPTKLEKENLEQETETSCSVAKVNIDEIDSTPQIHPITPQIKQSTQLGEKAVKEIPKPIDGTPVETSPKAVNRGSVEASLKTANGSFNMAITVPKEQVVQLAGPSSTSVKPIAVKATSHVHVPRPGVHQNLPADILPALKTLSELNISIVAADGTKISTGIDGRSALENLNKKTLEIEKPVKQISVDIQKSSQRVSTEIDRPLKRAKVETKTGAVFDSRTGLLSAGDVNSKVSMSYLKNLGSGFSITPVVTKKPEKRPVPPLISIEKTQKEASELISNVNMLLNRPDLKVEVKPVQIPEKNGVHRSKGEINYSGEMPEVLDLTKKKAITIHPIESAQPPKFEERKIPNHRLPYQPQSTPVVPFAPGLILRPGLPPNYLQMLRMSLPVVHNPAIVQVYKDMFQSDAVRMQFNERFVAMQQNLQKR
ncbi:AT-rich interactive domain-containing protein 5B-like isoform X2 [Artemia franciscana]|nr:hypothetical protein QYM36_012189 [Artemia franciscana]